MNESETWDVLCADDRVLVVKRWGREFALAEMAFRDFAKTHISHVKRIILMLPCDFEISGGRKALNLLMRRGKESGLELFTHALPMNAEEEVEAWRQLLRRRVPADPARIAIGARQRAADADAGDDVDDGPAPRKSRPRARRAPV
jgi:hypothetical protein